MKVPPTDWLQKVADGRLEMNGVNVWKALRYRAYVQVIDVKGNVMHEVSKLKECGQFRVTQRGIDLLEGNGEAVLPFDKNDLPLNIRLWTSAFRRWTRNCPPGLFLTFTDGQLHVLAADTQGKVKDDPFHRLASMKVPWHVVKV
jgi:hypothetical protein